MKEDLLSFGARSMLRGPRRRKLKKVQAGADKEPLVKCLKNEKIIKILAKTVGATSTFLSGQNTYLCRKKESSFSK